MLIDEASVFRAGSRVFLCAYRPVPDLHLPLIDHGDIGRRLVAWAMVPDGSGLVDCLVAFLDDAADGVLPVDIDIATSFGPRRLRLGETLDRLPQTAAGPMAAALLKAAGRRSCEDAEALVVAAARLGLPPAGDVRATLAADGRRLVVDGTHAGTWVAALTGDEPVVARVLRLTCEGAPAMRSCFDLDRPLPAGAVFILGRDVFVGIDCGAGR